jgi:hypothetical protein
MEMLDEILGPTDREMSVLLRQEFTKKGIAFYLGSKGGRRSMEKRSFSSRMVKPKAWYQ